MRSRGERDDWSRRLVGLGHGHLSGLWIEGPTVIVQSGDRLFVSNDHGAHFSRKRGVRNAGDCSYDAWPTLRSGRSARLVWRPTRSCSRAIPAARSHPPSRCPTVRSGHSRPPSGTVAVASGQGPLIAPPTPGRAGPRPPPRRPIGPTSASADPTHGVAIGNSATRRPPAESRLYYTIRRGGASYHYRPDRAMTRRHGCSSAAFGSRAASRGSCAIQCLPPVSRRRLTASRTRSGL